MNLAILFVLLIHLGVADPSESLNEQPSLEPVLERAGSMIRLRRPGDAAALLEFLPADVVKRDCRLAYLRGLARVQSNRPGGPEDLAGTASCSQVPGYLKIFRSLEQAQRDRDPELLGQLHQKLERRGAPESLILQADRILARSLLDQGKAGDALELLRSLGSRVGPDQLPSLLAMELEARAFPGFQGGRSEVIRRLLTEFPCSEEARPFKEQVQGWSLRDRFAYGRALYECWDYSGAEQVLQALLSNPRAAEFHKDCHFFLGEIKANKLRDRPADALAHFQVLAQERTGRGEYCLFQTARCHMKMEAYGAAAKVLETYKDLYPKGRFRDKADYYLGWLPFDHGQFRECIKPFEQYLDHHPKGEMRTYVIWFKGWAQYKLGLWEDALESFEHLARFRKDIVGGKGLYWGGVVLHRLGRVDEAVGRLRELIERYPLTWYSLLAQARVQEWTGKPLEFFFLDSPALAGDLPSVNWHPKWLSGDALRSMEEIGLLVSLGEIDLAREVWKKVEGQIRHRVPGRWRQSWTLAVGDTLEIPQELREIGRKEWPVRRLLPTPQTAMDWQMEYPRAYRRLVEVEAARWGIVPEFVYSVMRQESRYRRGVVSWADAVGLLQLILPTAGKVAAQIGLELGRMEAFLPEVNIRLGVAYLGMLYKEFSGSYILTAAAYNSGAPAIKRFLGRTNQGIDEAIEDIAYNEGRNYCRKVLGHLMTYLVLHRDQEFRRSILENLRPTRVPRTFPGDVDY